jgi:putative oxidoreductase
MKYLNGCDNQLRRIRLMFGSQDRKLSFGLLIMRFGLAAVLLVYSLPKLIGGTGAWQSVGILISFIDIGVSPAYVGGIILLIEMLGAVSLLSGYFFRIACAILFLLFGLYFFYYLSTGYETLMLWAAGLAVVFWGLVYMGPGRYAFAVKLKNK